MFAGWFQRAPRDGISAPDAELLISTLDPLDVADRQGTWSAPGLVLAQTLLHTTAEASRGEIPTVCPHTGNVIVSWIRLDNRDEICRDLGLEATKLSDAEVALAAYREWDVQVPEHLEGVFSLVIWDQEKRRLLLVRDRLGTRPLFLSVSPAVVAFATTQAALRHMPGVDGSEDPTWRAWNTVGLRPLTHAPVALKGADRLAPSQSITIDSKAVDSRVYFTFDSHSPWEESLDPAWLGAYKATLDRAILNATEVARSPLGFETSGGLDSSSVLAVAAATRPDLRPRMQAFGYCTLEREPEFVLETSLMWRIKSNHIFTDWSQPPPEEMERRRAHFAAIVGHQCEHGSVLGFWDLLHEVRAHEIDVLLSGFGGDQAVTSQGFEVLSELARAARWRLVLDNFPGRPGRRQLRGALWLARWHLNGNSSPTASFLQRSATADYRRRAAEFTDELGRDVIESLVETLMEDSQRTLAARNKGANAVVLLQLKNPWLQVRLEQSAILAASLGIEYRWPLLDSRLIQQYLSTPTVWKSRGGSGRHLHRRAMEGRLPARILTTNTKVMTH